jgi:hypothetical protein
MTTTHPNGRSRYAKATPAGDQYAALIWKGPQAEPRKLWFGTPVEALLAGVEYLKSGYQVRLSDGAVQQFSSDGQAPLVEAMRQQILAELADMDAADRAELLSRHRHPSTQPAPEQPEPGTVLAYATESKR